MERLIIFGRAYSFYSKKKDKTFYCLDYMDLSSGKVFTEYYNDIGLWNNIASQNIPIGTECVGSLAINEYNVPFVSSISIN